MDSGCTLGEIRKEQGELEAVLELSLEGGRLHQQKERFRDEEKRGSDCTGDSFYSLLT